jgi:hypothetical protein
VEVTSSSDGGKAQLGVTYAIIADIRAYRDAVEAATITLKGGQYDQAAVDSAAAAVWAANGSWLPDLSVQFSSRLIACPIGARGAYVGATFSTTNADAPDVLPALDTFDCYEASRFGISKVCPVRVVAAAMLRRRVPC